MVYWQRFPDLQFFFHYSPQCTLHASSSFGSAADIKRGVQQSSLPVRENAGGGEGGAQETTRQADVSLIKVFSRRATGAQDYLN